MHFLSRLGRIFTLTLTGFHYCRPTPFVLRVTDVYAALRMESERKRPKGVYLGICLTLHHATQDLSPRIESSRRFLRNSHVLSIDAATLLVFAANPPTPR